MSSKKENAVRKTEKLAAVKAAAPAAVKAAEPVMYVGPTIKGVAIQNRVYTEIPETAKKVMKDCPLLANLFVSVERYTEAERQLDAGKGELYVAFEAALGFKDKH